MDNTESVSIDSQLLSFGKVLQAGMKNLHPLKILCIKTALRNYKQLPKSLWSTLAPPVQALILEYLRFLTYLGKTIPLPKSDLVELVKNLLNSCVLRFDFSILGCPKTIKEKNMSEVAWWDFVFDDILYELSEKCTDLRTLREMRPVVEQSEVEYQHSFNRKICRLKKLVVLETNCYINSDDLCSISHNLHKLERLRVNYELGMGRISALLNLPRLEELVMCNPLSQYHRGQNRAVLDLYSRFQRIIPNLKIFGSEGFQDENWFWTRANQNQIITIDETSNYNLEECLLSNKLPLDSSLANQLPKVQRLMLRHPEPPCMGCLNPFTNLNSLQMQFFENSIELLSSIGSRLTELSLYSNQSHLHGVKVLTIFIHCPNLEYLSLQGMRGPINKCSILVPQYLKLKKLVLERVNLTEGQGVLLTLLKIPYLTEVSLVDIMIGLEDARHLNRYLTVNIIFQQLRKFRLLVRRPCRIPNMYQPLPGALEMMETLAKHVVSFCPKLRSVHLDLKGLSAKKKYAVQRSSLAPFINLVNSL